MAGGREGAAAAFFGRGSRRGFSGAGAGAAAFASGLFFAGAFAFGARERDAGAFAAFFFLLSSLAM
jgi:hypothetical protein